jgi:uncharacterized surface anchored protein
MFKSKFLKRIGTGIMAAVCAFSFATAEVKPMKAKAASEAVFPNADQIIAQAATLLGGNYSSAGGKGYYNMYDANKTPVAYDVNYTRSAGVDCSGLVYYTMTKLGYSTSGFAWNHPVPVDTTHWLSYTNPTISYKGTTKPLEIEKIRVSTNNHPYWERSNGSTIEPGSIVIGDPTNGSTDHAWIYMGEFDNKAAVKAYLKKIGVNPAYINDKNIHDNGDGGNHWRIEAQSTYGVVINNDTSGKYTGAMRVSSFKLNRNAMFTIQKTEIGTGKIVGISKVDGTSAVYGVYTDKSCKNKVDEIKINKNGLGTLSLPYGTYYVKEIKAPTGYNVSNDVYTLVPNETVIVNEVKTTGSIRINKTAEDGVKNREFMISWFENGAIHRERLNTNTLGVAKIDGLNLYDYDGDVINYTVSEINNDLRNVNPSAQTVTLSEADPNKDYTVDLYFNNEYKYGSLVLHKTHTDGNTDDRTFTVTGNGETYTVVTHGNEPAALEHLRMYDDDNNIITYTIHEENVPDRYVQPEDQEVTLLLNQVTDVYIVNSHVPGTLILKKRHEDGKTGDRNFTITGSDGSVRTAVTHGNEPTVISDLDIYDTDSNLITYTIHEENTPDRYEQPADQDVTLEYNKSKTVTIVNRLKRGSISIHKQNSETLEPVAGAKYEVTCNEDIYSSNGKDMIPAGETIYTLETDENGNAATPKSLPIAHTYTLTEVYVPDGYISGDPITIEMSDDGTQLEYRTTINEKPTIVKISKKSLTTKEELEGAKLTVTDDNGTIIDEWTSTTTEHTIIGKLTVGKEYTLTEVLAPDGFLTAESIKFTVNEDGSSNHITMYDEEKSGSIEVHKTTEGMINVEEISFTLSGTSDHGTEVNTQAITNSDGIATFEKIPVGTYTITEDAESVPYAYLVADEQEVSVMYAETTIAEIYNDEKSGTVEVHKNTKNKGNIADINFVLEGTSDSGRDVKLEAVTDKDGKAVFNKVPVGTYTITEDKETVPTAYLVAEKQEVNVLYAETSIAEVFNDEKTGSIEIHKTTEGMINIEGIKFILEGVSDSGTDVHVEAITDKDGKATFSNVPVGTYSITEDEKTVPTAYMVAEETEVTVLYAETVTKEIFNGERSGSISIQKQTEGMKDIAGINFVLEGTSDSGRTVKLEAVTDKDGKATFNGVPIGTYTITEDGKSVPAAYFVADAQTVTVFEAQTSNITFENKKKPDSSTPSTSLTTTSNPSTGVAANGAFAVTAIALALMIISRKRKNS